MNKTFLLLFFLCIHLYEAQTVSGNFRLPTTKYKVELVDTSEIVVLYEASTIKDVKTPKNKINIQVLLQVGKRFSKFLDVNGLKKDSLNELYSKQSTIGSKEMNELFKYKIFFNKNILKDRVSNKITVQDRFKDVYQYEEIEPKDNWHILDEEKTILGYTCKKATMHFRGRSYIAWYTSEIPISTGPYFFGGLPGLILKISDTEEQYVFTAIGIEKKKQNIYWKIEESIIKVSRTDFRKIQRNYFENPGLFLHGKAYDANGNEIIQKSPSKPYNPLELE